MAKNHYPFVYQATVAWYDGESNHYRIAGVGFCESFTDAVRQLEEKEGETLQCIEHLEIIGEKDETLIDIHPNWVRSLCEDDLGDYLIPYTKERV